MNQIFSDESGIFDASRAVVWILGVMMVHLLHNLSPRFHCVHEFPAPDKRDLDKQVKANATPNPQSKNYI